MAYSDVSIHKPNAVNLAYLWKHMRSADREEAEIAGLNDENYELHLLRLTNAFIGAYQNRPVIYFGTIERPLSIQLVGLATDELYQRFKYIHGYTKTYLRFLNDRYWDRRIRVYVWDEHTHSLQWLAKLGFENTGFSFKEKGKRLITMDLTNVF